MPRRPRVDSRAGANPSLLPRLQPCEASCSAGIDWEVLLHDSGACLRNLQPQIRSIPTAPGCAHYAIATHEPEPIGQTKDVALAPSHGPAQKGAVAHLMCGHAADGSIGQ